MPLKNPKRNIARDAGSLNNMSTLYHVANQRKQPRDPSRAPVHGFEKPRFYGKCECGVRLERGVCVSVSAAHAVIMSPRSP